MDAIRTDKLIHRIHERLIKHKLKPYNNRLKQIKQFQIAGWTNEQIRERSLELIHNIRNEKLQDLDHLMVEAYSLVIEAFWRVMNIRLFDVQIVAGIALHEGNLIEMQTGEGKTFAAVLPAYLNALSGKGVHILTFNDYLAHRDARWMSPLYEFLGLSVRYVIEGMSLQDRREAYAADITYMTSKEAGFDYLKDAISYDQADWVHQPFHYALIDEADCILLDEARIPLVIAGEEDVMKADNGLIMANIASSLTLGIDYDTDEHQRNVFLTESGVDRVEEQLGCGNLYTVENTALLTELNTALHAKALLHRDVDYIVRGGNVELVDEFTGRIADNRHFPDNLQRAVEAKEGISNQSSGRILGTITVQHFVSLYPKLSGMTATAQASADEFMQTYCLHVVVIPPHQPCRRIDYPHRIYTHKEAKYQALIKEIAEVHLIGRPILIGTASVEESSLLAIQLLDKGISCRVLNAQNDEMEAEILAQAGQFGAITVSTNMAGRGVDIALGGGEAEAEAQVQAKSYASIAKLGGLYVIGTSLHESVRIDHQLRGRAGRQGDPGSSRFYVCLEDDLIRRYGILQAIPADYIGLRHAEAVNDPVIHKSIEHIQRVINGQNHEIRKTLNKYADLVEEQRQIMHTKRKQVLIGDELPSLLATRVESKYQYICSQFGEHTAKQVEKHITLYQMDHAWADYLDYVSYIKEGIHLESISNKNPLDEFHRLIMRAYGELEDSIVEGIIDTFASIKVTTEGIDLCQPGLRTPTATWTYIVNDSFFQNRVSLF